MKVTIQRSEEKKVERTYPYFGESTITELIVFFTKPKTGIVIKGDEYFRYGSNCDDFSEMTTFTPITDPILIEP